MAENKMKFIPKLYNMIPIFIVISAIPFQYFIIVPARFFGVPLQYIPLVIFGVVNFVNVIINGKILIFSKMKSIYITVFVFLIYCTITFFWVKNRMSWLIYILQWYIYAVGILVLSSNAFRDKDDLLVFLKKYVIALVIAALLGIINYFVFSYRDANPFQLINRNGSIFVLVPFLPVLLSSKFLFRYKMNWWLSVLIVTTSILLIFSRTGYISLVLSFILYFFFNKISIKKYITKGLPIVTLCILITFAIYKFGSDNFKNVFDSRISSISNVLNFVQNDGDDLSSDWRRSALVRESFEIFKKNIFLGTGVGLENYLYYFNSNIETKEPARAHSVYISYLAELGILGYPTIIALLVSILIFFRKSTKLIASKLEKTLGNGFLIGHIVLLIAFITGEHITSPYVWLFWGIGTYFVSSSSD